MTRTRSNETKTKPVTTKLDALTAESKKAYGGDVILPSDKTLPMSHLPSGIFAFDLATFGGWPDGHMGLIHGWEHSAKSFLTLMTAVQAQKKYPDKTVVILDAENHYDADWATKIGLDHTRARVVHLDSGEQYGDMLDAMVNLEEVSLLILDSVPALIPMDDINKSAEDEVRMAARAKIMGRICSSIIAARPKMVKAGHRPVSTLFVNQNRDNITSSRFAPEEKIGGGNMQRFLSMMSVATKPPLVKNRKVVKGVMSNEIIVSDDYEFALKKPKSGYHTLTGKYTLVKSPLHARLDEGNIDDMLDVVTYAKKLGMIGGGGKTQTFMMFPDEYFAPKDGATALSVMAKRIEEDKHIYSLTKAVIVAAVRMMNEKPPVPADDYLMGHTSEEIVPYLNTLAEIQNAKATKV